MIRGKATEFNAFTEIEKTLNHREWSIQKLNLNPQSNTLDEDISITHKRTGLIFKVESKNAVRGSMRTGERSKVVAVPHCRIKCHRSRSNIKLAGTSNDRYSIDCFDIIISNFYNAIIQGSTISERLELLSDNKVIGILKKYYGVDNDEELVKSAHEDWRFAFPRDIAEQGFIPRTPYVKLENDPNWHPLKLLEEKLVILVQEKITSKSQRR